MIHSLSKQKPAQSASFQRLCLGKATPRGSLTEVYGLILVLFKVCFFLLCGSLKHFTEGFRGQHLLIQVFHAYVLVYVFNDMEGSVFALRYDASARLFDLADERCSVLRP